VTSTPPGSTSAAAASAEDAGAPACPSASSATIAGRIDAAAIVEVSGIVASALNPDVFWVHNDSGDAARVFAVRRTGQLLSTLTFDQAAPVDIEDIAIEDVGPGASFLYLGDIGDNAASRTELTIHRVAEPLLAVANAQTKTIATVSDKMFVRYVDGPHDAETLLFDPTTKDLLLATKRLFGGSAIHRVGPFRPGATVTTQKIATAGVEVATGGDISRDGSMIAIRNYGPSAFVWTRAPGEPLASALGRRPCRVPIGADVQGEAFAFLADGNGAITTSEGSTPPLHVVAFDDAPRTEGR
jgi:hypothetical protein